MTLSLSYTNGEEIFSYTPNEKLWWITGFDSSNQNVQASDLKSTVTIDFTGKDELFEGFYNKYGETQKPVWTFDGKRATITW